METSAMDDVITQYRRDCYAIIPSLLSPDHVAACLAALDRIAADAQEAAEPAAKRPFVALEPGTAATAAPFADRIRKFSDFTDVEPALLRAALSARLHAILDRIMGCGRVLMQEMALVKPPRIGGEKPWHQDAAYFRGSDPHLMFGVWIALDPADRSNGCMEVIRGSHLAGPVPHVPHADINLCTIDPRFIQADRRTALPMAPGDALIFHSLIHHYTAAYVSDRRRRALQFHYHQTGMEWTPLTVHRGMFHDADGEYAGCTVSKGAAFEEASSYVPRRCRAVIPVE